LLAFGRGDTIDGHMPMSISADMGRTWTYSASVFPPIGGGQRLVVTRLREGPIFFASFGAAVEFTDSQGGTFTGSGLFAALSYDEGQTWEIRRLITPGGPARVIDGGGNTGTFVMSDTSAEPKGYMSVHQTPDNVIHLISSKQHYAFNLAWLQQDPPPPPQPPSPAELEPRAEPDNAAIMHTYRLAVDSTGNVLIFRDRELLGARRAHPSRDNVGAPAAYLQWGEGAGASEADAVVDAVAFDLQGAFRPSE
jgi:hypothetical protein